MLDGKKFEITFNEEYVVMRTLDNINYPEDIWRFKVDELPLNHKVFIENMLSMSKTMIADKEKRDEGNKS
jgi:hypothetical protein